LLTVYVAAAAVAYVSAAERFYQLLTDESQTAAGANSLAVASRLMLSQRVYKLSRENWVFLYVRAGWYTHVGD
jgi:hypothetical protein